LFALGAALGEDPFAMFLVIAPGALSLGTNAIRLRPTPIAHVGGPADSLASLPALAPALLTTEPGLSIALLVKPVALAFGLFGAAPTVLLSAAVAQVRAEKPAAEGASP
jgi:hypothetical protein